METFSALLALCAGNSPITGEFPSQRPVTRSFNVFFNLRLDKRLSKQSRGWWSDTPSRSLWRHCNETVYNGSHLCWPRSIIQFNCSWNLMCLFLFIALFFNLPVVNQGFLVWYLPVMDFLGKHLWGASINLSWNNENALCISPEKYISSQSKT